MSEQELQPPAGWTIQKGAGGWRAVNKARKWETTVYLEKAGGAAKAVEAAIELEEKAARTLVERERLCITLRSCFRAAREGD